MKMDCGMAVLWLSLLLLQAIAWAVGGCWRRAGVLPELSADLEGDDESDSHGAMLFARALPG